MFIGVHMHTLNMFTDSRSKEILNLIDFSHLSTLVGDYDQGKFFFYYYYWKCLLAAIKGY